jgi:multiple sugar transport system permease protein
LTSLYYSLTDFSVLRAPQWVGLSNYQELFKDEVFHTTLWNTFIYVLGAVPLTTVMAILLALLLNTKVRGMALYRTLFFIPSLVPMVALGVLWLWLFNGEAGIINEGLRAAKLPTPNWLGDPMWSKPTLMLVAMWGSGHAMIIYLAGLQDIPTALYEAAELDGAKVWAKTRSVTLPMLSPVILFNGVMGIIGALQVFAVPYVMFPQGAPTRSTYFLTSYLFDNAFRYQRMGYASALGWVMFIITLVLTFISIRISEKHVHYDRS